MPARTKKEEEEILFFSSLVENNRFGFSFENLKILRKTPDFPRCSAMRKRGAHQYYFLFWVPIEVTLLLVFLSLVCIIMASQRALLVVYLVSLVYVRSAKCLGREAGAVGMGRWGGAHKPVRPALTFPYIHSDQVKILHQSPHPPAQHHPKLPPPPPPSPPGGERNLGRILFYLIKYLRLQKKRKEKKQLWVLTAFLTNFTQKMYRKKTSHIVQIYVTSTPEEIIKQWGDIEQRCTITFSVMIWNWWKRLR